MNAYGPWSREAVIDLHIFILLIIWMTLDRSNVYFTDIYIFLRKQWLYAKAYLIPPSNGLGGGH